MEARAFAQTLMAMVHSTCRCLTQSATGSTNLAHPILSIAVDLIAMPSTRSTLERTTMWDVSLTIRSVTWAKRWVTITTPPPTHSPVAEQLVAIPATCLCNMEARAFAQTLMAMVHSTCRCLTQSATGPTNLAHPILSIAVDLIAMPSTRSTPERTTMWDVSLTIRSVTWAKRWVTITTPPPTHSPVAEQLVAIPATCLCNMEARAFAQTL